MSEKIKDIKKVMAEAELLYSKEQVETALNAMALAINAELADKNPILLCIMTGGIVPTGMLLPRLNFPLQLDYVHATRYTGETTGREISWLRSPHLPLEDRVVLVIDDILDKGITLSCIIDECHKLNASEIYSAVLVDKATSRESNVEKANFTGLSVPNRYVFGYGMDYKDYLRNGDGIYAVKDL